MGSAARASVWGMMVWERWVRWEMRRWRRSTATEAGEEKMEVAVESTAAAERAGRRSVAILWVRIESEKGHILVVNGEVVGLESEMGIFVLSGSMRPAKVEKE